MHNLPKGPWKQSFIGVIRDASSNYNDLFSIVLNFYCINSV